MVLLLIVSVLSTHVHPALHPQIVPSPPNVLPPRIGLRRHALMTIVLRTIAWLVRILGRNVIKLLNGRSL